MSTLDELIAKDEIRDLLHRYCRAVDRCDDDLLDQLYHADATEDHGRVIGSAAEFRVHALARLRDQWTSTQHVLGSVLIELDGEVAFSEAYLLAFHVRRAEIDGRRLLDVLGARYVDRLERRDGAWRIAHRVVVKDWQDTRENNDLEGEGFRRQQRDRGDPAYQGCE